MSYRIRIATPADAAQVAAIYAPFVRDTVISFETEVPDAAEFERRIADIGARYAFIVAVDGSTDAVVGFAYNHEFRSRPAYDWSSEVSIYLAPEHQGRGLGSVLLEALEELMRLQGIRMAESCITDGNDASVAFHKRHGYHLCGKQKACGYKLGQWLSVLWLEKQLLPCDTDPDPRTAPDPDLVGALLERVNRRFAESEA